MKHAHLGDLGVARLGLGTMGMSFAYTGAGSDDVESIRTIHRAIDLGVNLIDTAEVYGPFINEELVGRALRGRREAVVLATKFGMMSHTGRHRLDSRPENIRIAVDGSLGRLATDRIDLYYQHRVDPDTPIEETVGVLTELIAAGKIRYIGLSEAGANTIRRAHSVHRITAVQSEYSLWTRDPESEVLPLLRELGNRLCGVLTAGARLTDGSHPLHGRFSRRRPSQIQPQIQRSKLRAQPCKRRPVARHQRRCGREPCTGGAGLVARQGA